MGSENFSLGFLAFIKISKAVLWFDARVSGKRQPTVRSSGRVNLGCPRNKLVYFDVWVTGSSLSLLFHY